MTRGGIFGASLGGKTTLAKHISRQYWAAHKIRTLVLDINGEQWGTQALVFTNEAKFWEAVWKAQHCLVIVDEATETINRDKTLTPVFTRLRHNQHKLLVIGHSGTNLLPIMRQQIDTLYLFQQTPKAIAIWREDFIDNDGYLEAAKDLRQYQFIRAEKWKGKPPVMQLPAP